MSKAVVLQNFVKSLIAVLVGNAVYFLLLSPVLPPSARHGINRIDLGLLVDFWVCVAVYGLIEVIDRRRKAADRRQLM